MNLCRLVLLTLAFGLSAAVVHAACSSPTATAGQMTYATNYNSMAYCDGTNWVSMAGGVSVTIGGTTNNYNATAAGSGGYVQYNDGSNGFAASSNFTYSAGLLTLTGTASATNVYAGNISTTTLWVNGQQITGNALGDRITSGTTSMVANSNTSIISITTAGVTTGYFTSAGLLVVPGISVTQNYGVSSTTGYFSGNVGIGTSSPALVGSGQELTVSGGVTGTIGGYVNIQGSSLTSNNGVAGIAGYNGTNRIGLITFRRDAAVNDGQISLNIGVSGTMTEMMRMKPGGIGVGTQTPATSLTVVGEVQVSNSGVACSSSTKGAIRYNNPSSTLQFCNSSTWSDLGTSATSPVAFRVYRNGSNQTITTNSFQKVQFDTEDFDTNNNFDSTTNYRFTPTVPGKYLITLQVYCVDGTACMAGIYKNNASVAYSPNISPPRSAISTVVDMNGSTDYIEGFAYNTGGTTIGTGIGQTNMSGVLIAASGSGGTGGSTNPGGNNTNIQFNNSGSFSGSDNLAWSNATNTVSVTGTVSATYGYFKYISATNGGLGVSALASLTDVSASSPQSGMLLRYNGSKWESVGASTALSTTTIFPNWPDAIVCGNPSTDTVPIVLNIISKNTGFGGTYAYPSASANIYVSFNADGTFNAAGGLGVATTGSYICSAAASTTISSLYAAGRAFNFIGNNGSGTALGDRITSGTTAVTTNSATNTISLTVNNVTTGYINSAGLLVVPGISLTQNYGVSSTTGYFSGNVMIGTTSPSSFQFDVVGLTPGQIRAKNSVGNARIDIDAASASYAQLILDDSGTAIWSLRKNPNNNFSLMHTTPDFDALYVVSSTGYVGIGTTAPSKTLTVMSNASSAQQILLGNAGQGAFLWGLGREGVSTGRFSIYQTQDGGTTYTEPLTVLTSGNVGIGVSAPSATLYVSGSTATTAMLDSSAVGGVYLGLSYKGVPQGYVGVPSTVSGVGFVDSTGNAIRMLVGDRGSVGIGTIAPNTSLTVVGEVQVSNSGVVCSSSTRGGIRYSGTSLQYCNASAWTTLTAGTSTPGGPSGSIQFNLNGGTLSGTAAFTFLNNDIGIGTGSPFHNNTFTTVTISGTNGGILELTNQGSLVGRVFNQGNNVYLQNYQNGNLYLGTYAAGGGTNRMMIDGSGNVGIGTSAPGVALDISSSAGLRVGLLSSASLYTVVNQNHIYSNNGPLYLNWIGTSNTIINGNGGNVGIGTNAPQTTLNQYGGRFYLQSDGTDPATVTSGKGLIATYLGSSDYGLVASYDTTGAAYKPLYLDASSLILNKNSVGKVGIGTSAPGVPLEISPSAGNTWGVQIDYGNLYTRLSGNQLAAFNGPLYLQSGSTSKTIINSSGGNVGVGMDPGYPLDVSGSIRIYNPGSNLPQLTLQNSSRSWSIYNNVGLSNAFDIYDATAAAHRFVIDTNGKVGIGTTGPSYRLDVTDSSVAIHGNNSAGGAYGVMGDAGAGGWGIFCNSGLCGGQAVWTNNSDRRLKKDIQNLPSSEGLAAIMKLRPVSFEWKDRQQAEQGKQLGFIAQEVEKIFPEVVVTSVVSRTITLKDGEVETIRRPKNLSYATLVTPLVKAVQELKADNDNLRSQVNALKADNDNIHHELEELRAALQAGARAR